MAKGKKNKPPLETVSCKSGQPSIKTKASTGPAPTKAMTVVQPSASVKQTAMATDNTKVSTTVFQAFISDMEASLSIAPAPAKAMATVQPAPISVKQTAMPIDITYKTKTWRCPPRSLSQMTVMLAVPSTIQRLSGKDATTETIGAKRTSFAGLFSTNRRLTDENKLRKIAVNDETLKLDTNDLIDVRTKLGHCLVGYITGKFMGLKVIGALSKSWGATFQQHASGWLVFKFATEEDMQRIVAGGPYFVFGRPLMLKTIPACFDFQEGDISLTPIWATLPSLECWNPDALSKIGSRLGNPIAMDSLTMKMERISYARIWSKLMLPRN
ncbi:UNVERIFIED_CONTAM: hypothetical protein Slati_3425400 [Sesamum latifolium]|uniref:DUF4283 domain-containing protein n=1 Tax=Sesamum latifolium TaxID=2727402 RepID=A0AAW2UI81_9LAMI